MKSGSFPRELAHHLGQAFDVRMKADYRVFAAPNSVELRELLEHARAFVSKAQEVAQDR